MKPRTTRRNVLRSAFGLAAAGSLAGGASLAPGIAWGAALTREQRDAMSPNDVLARARQGNESFVGGKTQPQDYLAQKRATAAGQYPAAAILSCIDSRAPAEIILDARIGDTFNARVAGNIVNDDLLGSLEFACAVAGAKLVLVMGHTACGAIKGAIDGAKLGHLTALLDHIHPAVTQTRYEGDRSTKNASFVDAVAATNVRNTVEAIRARSRVLADLEEEGKIKVVGSMYDIATGKVDFFG